MINNKILICGNGPSLISDLKDRNLDIFNYIVRLNNWKLINGFNNRCDVWCTSFWYDITVETINLNKDKIIWDAMMFGGGYSFKNDRIKQVKSILDKTPEFYLSKQQFNYFRKYIIQTTSPSTGMYAIYMGMLQNFDITICGFDNFLGNQHHYFSSTLSRSRYPHKGSIEKLFIERLISAKKIKHISNL